MNWVDTALLVYKSVTDHPAKEAVDTETSRGAWGSTVLVLPECYQVLTRTYRVAPADAAGIVARLSASPIYWATFDLAEMVGAVAARALHGIDTADAVLLHLAKADLGTLVTSDRKLLRAAQDHGVAALNPITRQLAAAITQWEAVHLPPKGLSRLLHPIERWLRARAPNLADELVVATAGLTQSPV